MATETRVPVHIRDCDHADNPQIHGIVLEAAQAYRDHIPADCWHEPYMSRTELDREITTGVRFLGAEVGGFLVGVMGIQPVKDVSLIRHAYVRPSSQGQGVGSALLTCLIDRTDRTMLVGTRADAAWAVRFYQRHGFRLTLPEETEDLLTTYWTVPARQREVSIVLRREAAHA